MLRRHQQLNRSIIYHFENKQLQLERHTCSSSYCFELITPHLCLEFRSYTIVSDSIPIPLPIPTPQTLRRRWLHYNPTIKVIGPFVGCFSCSRFAAAAAAAVTLPPLAHLPHIRIGSDRINYVKSTSDSRQKTKTHAAARIELNNHNQ